MSSVEVTLALGAIVVLGIGAQWVARRTGMPSIVLLLLSGIVAGPVTGPVDPEALFGDLLEPAVTLAVGLLLFDSGFGIRFRALQEGRAVVRRLVTVGLLITWAIASASAYLIFDLDRGVALLLGAVLVVSGPTVVGPILRSARPSEPTGTILEWEGTLLDPIGAAFGVAMLTVVTGDALPVVGTLGLLLVTAATGVGIGLACALILVLALRYFAIPEDLEVPVAFMMAVLAFTAANVLFSEAGLFATLTLGLALANQDRASVTTIRQFQASIGSLVIGTLFIVLAATIDLDALGEVILPSLGLLAILVLVARPVSAWASTLGSPLGAAERGFVASVAPRGIVAASTVSFYALTLDNAGMAADRIVPITFAIIIGAGVVYGFGAPVMARILQVSRSQPTGIAFFMERAVVDPIADELVGAGVSVLVIDEGSEQRDEAATYRTQSEWVDADDLVGTFRDAGIGSALVGSTRAERDIVAFQVAADLLGAAHVHFVPRQPKGAASGVESLWRQRTPDRLVAFGPDVTRDTLRAVARTGGSLAWYPVEDAAQALPPGTVPLFLVGVDGSCQVANQQTLRRARRGSAPEGGRVLCARPGAAAPTAATG